MKEARAVRALDALLIAILFAAYLVPWLVAISHSPVVTFEQAWDETTYLTYQGAASASNTPGYYILHFNVLLHRLGVSGAMQNFFSDLLSTPATLLLIAMAIRSLGRSWAAALMMASVVLFGSVLFNYANPAIVAVFGPAREFGWLIPGTESYVSALRTPTPQYSFFLIAAVVVLWRRTRRDWLLLLPIPLLYYFVLAPYLYILGVAILIRYLRVRSLWIANLISYVGLSIFFAVAFRSFARKNIAFTHFAHDGRRPVVALAAIAAALIYLLAHLFCRARGRTVAHRSAIVTLILCSLAVTNLQLIAGFFLYMDHYVDTAVGILACLAIAATLDGVLFAVTPAWTARATLRRLVTLEAVVAAIAGLMLITYNFPLRDRHFAVYCGWDLKDPTQWERMRRDPLHAIIAEPEVAVSIAYGTAGSLIPPLAAQYRFPLIAGSCPGMLELRPQALAAAERQWGAVDPRVLRMKDEARREQVNYETAPRGPDLCGPIPRGDFYFVETERRNIVSFPP